jgi:hypothetical protein
MFDRGVAIRRIRAGHSACEGMSGSPQRPGTEHRWLGILSRLSLHRDRSVRQ